MKHIKSYFNNIQILQNINLLSILFISKLFFDFPILYSEIFIVLISIIVFEYIYKKIFNVKNISFSSGINTGVGILFFLKTSNPLLFILAVFISISSKYLIKYKGKHFLNPSNFGLISIFLLFPNSTWVIGEQWDRNYFLIAYILLFGLYILYKARLILISISFIIVFSIGTILFLNPSYSALLFNLTNISVILFLLFMITDPKIIPKKISHILYGSSIAIFSILLQYIFKNTYVLLLGLTIISFFNPLINKYKNKLLYSFIGIGIIILLSMNYNISNNINNNYKIELKETEYNIEKETNNKIKILKFNFNKKESNISKIEEDNDFKKQIIFSEQNKNSKGYYLENGLNKNSIGSGYFNNDDYLDFFTITSKGLTIGLYDNEKKSFNIIHSFVQLKKDTPNIFYRAIDYNYDGFYDIITNNNSKLEVIVYINQKGNGTFIPKKLGFYSEGYQGITFADFNSDYIMDFLIPANCERTTLDNSTCKDNYVFMSSNKGYKKINLDNNNFNTKGPTLTSLYGELLKDKKSIYIGNDFSGPDTIYNIEKNGNIILDTNIKDYIPATTFQTMSCDSGDINNDGLFDLFCTDMLFQDNIYNKKVKIKNCEELKGKKEYLQCKIFNNVSENVNELNLQGCIELKQNINNYIKKNKIILDNNLNNLLSFETGLCINQVLIDSANKTLDENLCKKIDNKILRNECIKKITIIKEENKDITKSSNDITIFPKQKGSNVLLINKGDKFEEETLKYNIKRTDWSWNSNMFDINNDNLLDIYVVNGTSSDVRLTPNHLFINKGNKFKEKTNSILSYIYPTSVYTYGDFDNDFDNDIIIKDLEGNIIYFQNKLNKNLNKNMLKFNIIIEKDNKLYKNISNIILKAYDNNNKILFSRENKLSGGYNSLNSLLFLINKKNIKYFIINYNGKTKKIKKEHFFNRKILNIILK